MNIKPNVGPANNSADETAAAIVKAIHQNSDGAVQVNSEQNDAAEKLQQLGMLIGKVAHELRNPLRLRSRAKQTSSNGAST